MEWYSCKEHNKDVVDFKKHLRSRFREQSKPYSLCKHSFRTKCREGLDKHFLADAASMQLMGVNGLGQTITTISRPRQMELEPEATLRDYSHITPQKRVKVLPMEECGTLHRPYVKNIQTDV
ncbi:nephrin [Caerostris extrusa]|uniref:Nephrin n=1 Tax=Caerostris extrusa TaxID=172846 RepID=A0AAV4WAU6_CAEEX|nr:nephrin [Caerostris extrusa]